MWLNIPLCKMKKKNYKSLIPAASFYVSVSFLGQIVNGQSVQAKGIYEEPANWTKIVFLVGIN